MICQLSHIIVFIQSFSIWFKMPYFMGFFLFTIFSLPFSYVAYSDIDTEIFTYYIFIIIDFSVW